MLRLPGMARVLAPAIITFDVRHQRQLVPGKIHLSPVVALNSLNAPRRFRGELRANRAGITFLFRYFGLPQISGVNFSIMKSTDQLRVASTSALI